MVHRGDCSHLHLGHNRPHPRMPRSLALVVDALDGVAGWRTGKLKQEALDYTANALLNPDAALLNRLKTR